MENIFDEQRALAELEKGYDEAKKLLEDEDKTERFLQRLEKKLKTVPLAGEKLSYLPVMASLVRSFIKKEYTDIPIGSIIAIISTLTYFLSPVDVIPDAIPVIGYLDDTFVVAACWRLVESDVSEYLRWRDKNNKTVLL